MYELDINGKWKIKGENETDKKKKKKITGSGKRKRGGKADFRAGHLPKTNRFEVFIFVF
jgi:hypothetical protein